jgi:hypothetical protein
VRVQGEEVTYATHKRELYQLRGLFSALVAQHFGHRLQTELGVRVQKTQHGISLPDVPKPLCKRSAVRTKQIDTFIAKNHLKNTPLTRAYGAIVTRRQNRDKEVGRRAFRELLTQSGFGSGQIYNRVPLDPLAHVGRVTGVLETRHVAKEAERLAKTRLCITQNDLLTKALETAKPGYTVSGVVSAVKSVLDSPHTVGLAREVNKYGKPVYVPTHPPKLWVKIAQKVEFVLKAKSAHSNTRQESRQPGSAKESHEHTNGRNTTRQSAEQTTDDAKADRSSKRSDNARKVVEKAIRSCDVIGAVGRAGIKAAAIAIDLYQTFAKPIWRVHGSGHKNMPGSVAKMVRDLKPLPWLDAQKAAILAMLKLNGTLDQKLRYGEHVYRQSRKAKFRVPRKALIVIRDASSADPRDLTFLLRKAKRAKAKTIFVEREYSRFALLQAAKSMKPGEQRHFYGPELKR